jgi:hypothetical protein
MSVFIAYLIVFILFTAFKISVSEILVLFEIFRNGYVPGTYLPVKPQGNSTTPTKDSGYFIV